MTGQPMRHYLTTLIRYAPGICFMHAFFWAVLNFSTLLYGILLSRLVSGIDAGNQESVRLLVLGFAGLGLGQAVLWLVAGRTEIAMRFRMSGVVRRNLLRILLAIPGGIALQRSVGDTISRFRDDAYLAEDAMDWTNEIVPQVLIACSALGVMLWIDASLTIFTVTPTIAIILSTRFAGKRLARLRRRSSEATSQFTSAVGDVIAVGMAIQLAGARDRAVQHIAELATARRGAALRDRALTQLVEGISRNASALGTGLVMLLAASRIRNGELTVPDFVLFTAWFGMVTTITVDLGNYLAQMAAARVAFERMEEMTTAKPASMSIVDHTPLHLTGQFPSQIHSGGPTCPPRVGTESSRTIHPSADLHVITPTATFTLRPGEVTVVTGRIGAGKSNLVRALIGLDPTDGVHLTRNGNRITNPVRELSLGYVPQVPRLFSGTIRENILLGRDVDDDHLREAVHLAMLDADLAQFPDGLETMVGTRGLQVSGGQAQRIAVARALVTVPELLVVDDPSSALDIETERALWQGLQKLPDLTILAVSHRRIVLQQADRVVVMKGGEIGAIGRLEDVLVESTEMRTLWEEEEA
ncbi:MAG: ABC transporter ATP-binding protein/permease [Thermomicrobiales bacterium]|nr:ABC transporter ATP-binding protein/permease [Thermomicrobiales bacterium]